MTTGQEARSLFGRLRRATSRAMHSFERQPLESDAFLRRLLQNLPGMAYRCANDEDWTVEFASTGCRALTGFAPSDLEGNRVVSYATLIHVDDRDRVWEAVQAAIASQKPFEITYRIRRADGAERWVREQGCAVFGDDGRVEALEGFVADITDRADLRARVWDQDSKFRALAEQGLAGVYLVQDGAFRYVNDFLAQMLGYTVAELLSLTDTLTLVDPEDRATVAENLERRLRGELDEVQYEVRLVCKDGSVRDAEVHGRRIDLEGRPAVMGVLLDITHRKAAERRYHEGQKMEALGRMATGVAHDLNNFLGSIRTSAELMLVERPEDAALTRELYQIVSAVERGSGLGRQLMDFGRATHDPSTTSSVGVVLEDLVPMLGRAMGEQVTLRAKLEPRLPEARLGQSHLQQVLTNLVLNAGEAIPGTGTVTISVYRAMRDAEGLAGPASSQEPRVAIEVTDDGAGIEEAVRARIFEPYFTTKGYEGTGLGLANVWRIVEDAGGTIEVDSTVGVGTTFRVFLPTVARGG